MKSFPLVINGIRITPNLLSLTHARKYLDHEGQWVLATMRGVVVATFSSERELDSWWQIFQSAQGRAAQLLVRGRPEPRPKGRRKKRYKGGNGTSGLGNPIGTDYLKPWSSKYDMPDYDLE
jgi:hypothetical protein